METATNTCRALADLEPGRVARICAHAPQHPVPLRLEELGFVPGTALVVLRRAPLGDPVEIELRGYRVCLRREDLASVCVTPDRVRP
jgi:ferrous iron transport protein A